MGHFHRVVVTADEKSRRSDLAWNYLALAQMDHHLDNSSADAENVLFFKLPQNDSLQVELQIIEDAVKGRIILDDLFDGCQFLSFGVVE